MVHTYNTTHYRHSALHGFGFSLGALTMAAIVGGFMVHWIVGIASILPLLLLNGYINILLETRATYVFLREDCGVSVTWDDAREMRQYFSPNRKGKWIDARFLRELHPDTRHKALLDAISRFDAAYGKPDSFSIGTTPSKIPIYVYKGETECPRGHGPLQDWQGTVRCWKCGWPYR